MDVILQQYFNLIGGWKVVSIGVLILVDTILGIILAIKSGTFQWRRVGDFMDTSIVIMFAVYFLVGVVAMAETSYQVIVPSILAIIDGKLLIDIGVKLQKFGVSIVPVPTPTATTAATTTTTPTPATPRSTPSLQKGADASII